MAAGPSTWFTADEMEPNGCPACGEKQLLPPLPVSGAQVCIACGRVSFPVDAEPAE
jgi:hypothetical protein